MRHLSWFLGLIFCFAVRAEAAREFPTRSFAVEVRKEAFSSGGRKIRVELFAPKASGRFPAVLVLHSAAGTILGKGQLKDFSRALAERGMVALLVHYFDRTGTWWAGDDEIDRLSRVWIETVKDAVDFAAAHPRVCADRIGIFGYSLGAYIGIAVSARDRRVDAVAEVAGGIFEGFRPRMLRVPPLLILHGRVDQRVPVARAFELQRAARQLGREPRMKIYDREGHVLSKPAAADATTRTISFFRQQLRAPSALREGRSR